MHKICCCLSVIILALNPVFALCETVYSAWLPYWLVDDSLEEMALLEDELDNAICFAAMFDEDNHVYLERDAKELMRGIRLSANHITRTFISVVNDQRTGEETYDQKTLNPIRAILADEEAMEKHIRELLILLDECEADGLELDYENFKDDEALYASYMELINRLYTILARDHVPLRIVLHWNAPKYTVLPEGPEYVVMCYNLYGNHSGPGPKADKEFLKQTAEYYRPYVNHTMMAFATGGFLWTNGKVETALDQLQAEKLIADMNLKTQRDGDSGAIKASYTDDMGDHEIWYADGNTLSLWKLTLEREGYTSFDLFRLSGNNVEDLKTSFFKD